MAVPPTRRHLRIAQASTPSRPIKRQSIGSVENWLHLLTRRLIERRRFCRAAERPAELEVLHSHAYLWGARSQDPPHNPHRFGGRQPRDHLVRR